MHAEECEHSLGWPGGPTQEEGRKHGVGHRTSPRPHTLPATELLATSQTLPGTSLPFPPGTGSPSNIGSTAPTKQLCKLRIFLRIP